MSFPSPEAEIIALRQVLRDDAILMATMLADQQAPDQTAELKERLAHIRAVLSEFDWPSRVSDADPLMTLRHCEGCEDNFYNSGGKRCWSLKTAMVQLRRRVGMWESPPWRATPERLPSCYHEKGFLFVGPNQER